MIRRFFPIGCAVAFLAVGPAIAQNGELQEKVAAVKQSVAENKQKLQQYQWIETTQLALKGDPKPASTNLCRYGLDGQVQKNLVSPPPEPPSGGRMKQKIIAKKKEEMNNYTGDVKALLSQYVPPDAQRMQQAYQAGKVSRHTLWDVIVLKINLHRMPRTKLTTEALHCGDDT
jgi:hypothetical protein